MPDPLQHLIEFRQVLDDYQISDNGKKLLTSTNLVLLVAPTSAGRNTIITELVKTGQYHYIVSDTTRKPRINNGVSEQNGREYWFRTEKEVLSDLQRGEYLEAAIIHNQQVSGISLKELEKAHSKNKVAITDIEVKGAEHIHEVKPNTIILFILPPGFKEWIRRLQARSNMTDEEFSRRMTSAAIELKTAIDRDYYQFVINDQFDATLKLIKQIAKTGKINKESHIAGLNLARELYWDLQDFLQKNKPDIDLA